ncbi:GRAM domain-containing protein 2A-like isoform 2-T2 [Aulostomus maculatus]
MCLSWKCVFSIMSLKSRRFSLDSSVLDSSLTLGVRRASKLSKKSRPSLEEGQLDIQELNRSLNSNITLREKTIMEEGLDRPDGIITRNGFLKHNKTFHKLFPEISEGENLTHTFTCALQKEVPYHGKLFVSDNHACFYSSVLLKDTKVVISLSSVQEVKKQNSALSMLSLQTADGEKYSFVSLRNRQMCYKLLQTICSQAQGGSTNSSPHISSGENEGDPEVMSSYSSLEDSVDRGLSRQSSICVDNFPLLSSEGPSRCNTRQSSMIDDDNRATSLIWSIVNRVTPARETVNLSVLFYIYMMIMVMLLLASGYIGLRIVALEEHLNNLGSLTARDHQPT